MSALYIISVDAPDDIDLLALSEALSYCFEMESRIGPSTVDPEFAYDPARGQYHSTEVLAALLRNQPEGSVKMLGVTDVDLFIPILTFVFGEAQLNGPAALVSTHRLRNQFYGLPKDGALLQGRLEKEAIHEMAHTFGLVHCLDQTCVLNSSTYVENIDLKGKALCIPCREVLASKKTRA
ncbi:MAG: archaemetzincin family Zn-dependent metalloprotease [Thermoplasmata archaeon]